MELEVWQLVRLARRWWWLLVLGPLVGAVVAFAVSTREQAEYTAVALIRINPAQISDVIVFDDLHNGETLTATYRLLVWTPAVLSPVIEELGLDESVESLGSDISAWPVEGTQLMQLSVVDRDPDTAAAIANAAANSLVRHVSQDIESLSSPARVKLDAQIADTQDQIDTASEQIQVLEASPAGTEAQISALQTNLDQLQDQQVNLLQTAQLMDLDAALATNQVTVAAEAVPPAISDASNRSLLTLFGALAGLLVGAAVVSILGFMDRTVRAGTDFGALIGVPQLSAVPDGPQPETLADQLFMLSQPEGESAEAIRLLRINLELAAGAGGIGTLAVASPGPDEGKTTIAANLAVALAQAGMPVMLIDANLRDPSLHALFGVPAEPGLSAILSDASIDWAASAIQTGVTGLWLLPGGSIPPNPADLLSRDRFKRLLEEIGEAAEVIIFDTPAVEAGSDALVIAANSDTILLVGRAGQTRTEALQTAVATLRPAAARIVGVVLNRETDRGPSSSRVAAPNVAPAGEAAPAVLNLDPEPNRR